MMTTTISGAHAGTPSRGRSGCGGASAPSGSSGRGGGEPGCW